MRKTLTLAAATAALLWTGSVLAQVVDPGVTGPVRRAVGAAANAAGASGVDNRIENREQHRDAVRAAEGNPQAAARVASEAVDRGMPVFVQKTQFSVWTGNPAMETFASALTYELEARPEIILAGVATDVCDDQAIRGFLERGYPVAVVRDAIHSLGSQPDDAILAGWEALGARTTTLAALEAEFVSPATSLGVR